MANTTFQGPVTSKAGFITTGPANVVDADSSISLTVASHSGKIVHNDAAGAVTYTLPATNANSDSAVAGPGADLNNLSNVVTIPNNILQGQFKQAGINTLRFSINSTLGIAGIFDVASYYGLNKLDKEDYGQTLGTWGVKEGCYFV